jgi:hypothetical protein
MRTTLDVDDDILEAVKELARSQRKTAGKVISDLARKGFRASDNPGRKPLTVNGFEVMAPCDRVVTPRLIHKILEETDAV